MVPGLNTNVERNGAVYHVQTEDFGRAKPIIQSLIYFAGQVITALESSYEEFALSDDFAENEIRRKLTGQHYRLVAEIEAGGFDVAGAGDHGADGAAGADEEAADPVHTYLDESTAYDEVAVEHGEDVAVEGEGVSAVEPDRVASVASVEPMPAAESPSVAPVAPVAAPPVVSEPPQPRIVIEVQSSVEDRHTIDVGRVVQVHQAVDVQQVVEVEREVRGVLERLDEHLDERRAERKTRRLLPWVGAAGVLALVALVVVGLRLRPSPAETRIPESGTAVPSVAAAVTTVDPAPPPETPEIRLPPPRAPEGAPNPEPPPAHPAQVEMPEPPRPVDRTAPRVERTPPEEEGDVEPPRPATSRPPSPVSVPDEHRQPRVEMPAQPEEQVVPVASAGGDSGPAEGGHAAATLAPPVPRPAANAPDPLRAIETAGEEGAAPTSPPPPAAGQAVEPAAPAPKVRPGMLLELASVDVVPKPMQRGFPEYPKRARKKGHQGDVKLELLIDERGNVAQIALADGVAESDLSDAAVEAARAWKYTPARKERHAVRVWKPVTVRFTLDAGNVSRVRVEE